MVQVPLILRQFGKERLIDGLYHILTEQVVLQLASLRLVVPVSEDQHDARAIQLIAYGVVLALCAVVLSCLFGNARQLRIMIDEKLCIVHVLLSALHVAA